MPCPNNSTMVDHGCDDDGSHEILMSRPPNDSEDDKTVVGLGGRVYALTVLTVLTITRSIQEYLLIVTISGMAGELKFGKTQCQVINETGSRDYLRDLNMTGEELCSERGRCSENSTFFLPDVCGIRYTGRGTTYDVLAGPIYLTVQGIVTVPLIGLVQGFSMSQPISISMFTMLSTLFILLTAFVDDYWAVVLLRFLFGIFSGPIGPLKLAYLTRIFPKEVHTIVLGLATYGVTLGYGASYLFAYVTESIGWRLCYTTTGSAGLVLAILCFFMADPKRPDSHGKKQYVKSSFRWHHSSLRQIAWPCLICILLASIGRLSATRISSYNLPVYVTEYFPESNSAAAIGLITIVLGAAATIIGGWTGDRMRKVFGLRARLGFCLFMQVVMVTFWAAMYQFSFIALLILLSLTLFVGDWISILILAIVSDLTPVDSKALIFAINSFLSHSLVGPVNLVVTPVATATGLRTALTLLIGLFAGSSVFFFFLPLACSLVPETTQRHHGAERVEEQTEVIVRRMDETTPLL
ncbi:uncharacterized protein LOC129277820 [Lytechinus pictus]|uniref:uncharacterized protein LOC129277820 n=1 Tax=Lytechinus pictus TaxID=7653 RepID=UPI0030BA1110